MITVYYEDNTASVAVAKFASEEAYMVCLPALEAHAKAHNWLRVTDSVDEEARL